MKSYLIRACLQILFITVTGTVSAATPVVSNVRASQIAGTNDVEILYDVADADSHPLTIAVRISGDGGQTYTIPAVTFSGHIGAGVTSGINRRIVWSAGLDWNGQFVPSMKVRVTATDGVIPAPPPGMVIVPGGPFQMGDNFLEGGAEELPVHNVQVATFAIDRYEVSRDLWLTVQAWGAARGYDVGVATAVGNGYPITKVTWFEAVKWCNARSEKEGLAPCYYIDDAQTQVYRSGSTYVTNAQVKWTANGYRLPTEAEWEKAARGGVLGKRYPWGDETDTSKANYSGTGPKPCGYYNGGQTPAGTDMANGYGLYDMAGNVPEWCWDWYGSTYYGATEANNNPRGPASGTSRVWRGGSWFYSATSIGCARRGAATPSTSFFSASIANGVDFRCVVGF